jgi:DNA-binding MarR family transcriptional regulator
MSLSRVEKMAEVIYNVNMQLLAKETIISPSPSDCSEMLLEVTPVIMHRIRDEMRRRTMPGLTVPQLRTLMYLKRNPKSSLSAVADHLGLTLPSTSKLVQKLVVRKVVIRRVATDRRRVCLSLTQQGLTALTTARLETGLQLAESLSSLTREELSVVSAALRILNLAFAGGDPGVNLPKTL